MKRLISLFLVLVVMVTSFVAANAEETLTTDQKTPKVIYRHVYDKKFGRKAVLEIMGYEDKQPLIFVDTPENPKTDFSYMTREEIDLLPDSNLIVKDMDDPELDMNYEYYRLKTALLDFETLYEYTTKKDGSVERKIRTKSFSKNKNLVMYYPNRDDKNMLMLSGLLFEYPFLYEQYGYALIYEVTPYVRIDRTEGSTSEKLFYIYCSIEEPTKSGNYLIPRDVAGWTTKKPKKQIESDMEYVRDALLNVTEDDFEKSYSLLVRIFVSFSYKFDNGESAIITKKANLKRK